MGGHVCQSFLPFTYNLSPKLLNSLDKIWYCATTYTEFNFGLCQSNSASSVRGAQIEFYIFSETRISVKIGWATCHEV